MHWEYKTDVVQKAVSGNSYEPDGMVFETIELQSRLFGDWAPASVSPNVIRDELAKAIADELVIDVEWSKDPRSGYAMGKFSSVVYMKPDLKELHKQLNDSKDNVLRINKERMNLENINRKMGKELEDLEGSILDWQNKYFEIQRENSKLTVEMNCKFHDHKFLIKQGFRMAWLHLKCELYYLSRFIPFRG